MSSPVSRWSAAVTPRLPAWLRPASIGWVFVGGTLGAATRDVLTRSFVPDGPFPWTTLIINVSGAFLLGCLLDLLARAGPDTGWRRRTRLLLGSGFLGAYTTYSTLVVESVRLGESGSLGLALAYDVCSILAGFGAAYLATWLVRRLRVEGVGASD